MEDNGTTYAEQDIRMKVSELVALTKSYEKTKERIDELKAYFERLAEDALSDTKLKTARFGGNNGERVIVTESETIKPVSITMLKSIFGNIVGDFIKEDVKYTLSKPFSRILTAVFSGNYTESTLDALIDSISDDEKIKKTLRKKLKGNYEKDKAAILALTGCTEQEASDNAYLATEVINWTRLLQMLEAAQWDKTTQEAIDQIKASIIVDEGLKVTVEAAI